MNTILISQRMTCLRLLRSVRPQPSVFKFGAVQYSSQHPLKFLETQNRWKEKDDISNRWQLIYKAPMGNILNYATVYLTFTTVAITCSGLYYVAFVFNKDGYNDPVVVGDDIVIANSAMEGLIYLCAFVLFHAAVKMVLSKYVLRLYKDSDNYLAVFRGHWFNSIVKHQFHLRDFKKLKPSMIVTWSESKYSLGKKDGILFENYFKTPQYLNYLLYKQKNKSSDEDQEN